MANTSIVAAFERMWQHITTALSKKSDISHNHDDMYYTELEIDEQLNLKSDIGHTHNSIIEVNKNIEQKFWRGTQSEYDALETKSDDTMYIVIDGSDDNAITGLPSVNDAHDGKYLKVVNGNWVVGDSNYTDAEKAKLAGIADGANKTIIDTSLSVSGQAADAKAVGDALATKQPVGNYATETYVDSAISAIPTPDVSGQIGTHNTSTSAHNDIRLLVSDLSTRLNTLADSDDTTLDQMSEIVAYIKSNKSLIEEITTNKVNVSDIIDNLTTNVSNRPLSAAQGVALKTLIDAITVPTKVSELTNDSGYLTSYTETDPTVPTWAKAVTKPSYTASEVGALPLSGGTLTGTLYGNSGISLTATAASANNSQGVTLLNSDKSARVSIGSSGGLGIYSDGDIFIRPRYSDETSYGIKMTKTDMSPTTNASLSLGTSSSMQYNDIYGKTIYQDGKQVANKDDVPSTTESWTFTLEDGSTVTKAVYVG